MQGDVEAVQHVQRVAHLGGDHLQVGLPHVAANKTQPADHLGSQRRQTPPQRGLGAPAPYPQQPPTMTVDLVDHGQEASRPFAPGPVEVVHPDGLNSLQFPVRQTPLHKPLHRTINGLPTGLENLRRLSPRQPPRPPGQQAHHRRGDGPLAFGPGNMLHHDPVLGTIDPPRSVEEMALEAPHRRKQPGPLGQLIIAGGWLAGTGSTWRQCRHGLGG